MPEDSTESQVILREAEIKQNIYELTDIYLQIKALVESDADFTEAFEQAEGDLILKYENMGKVVLLIKDDIAELKGHIDRLQLEIDRLTARIASKNGALSRILFRLQEQYRLAEISKSLSYPLFDIQIEKMPPSVLIEDERKIPASFMNIPTPPPTPDKKRIKEHCDKTGNTIDGVRIIDNKFRLVIRSGRNIIAASEGFIDEKKEGEE